MQFDLETAIETIKSNKNFLKLKDLREDNVGHNGETTYEHCIQTYEKAKELVKGDLITNQEARKRFNIFINEEVDGAKKRDLLQIVALVHDFGKAVVFNDTVPLFKDAVNGRREAPYHGYWGSLLLDEILVGTGLSPQAINHVKNAVRLHLAGLEYWQMDIDSKTLLWELKLRCEGLHADVIFNIYCDLYNHNTFKEKINLPIELLNMPEAYEPLNPTI